MSFMDKVQEQREKDEAERAEWALGDYIGEPCPNCNRLRLCKCDNGKHRCEKCNWVPEDKTYCRLAL